MEEKKRQEITMAEQGRHGWAGLGCAQPEEKKMKWRKATELCRGD